MKLNRDIVLEFMEKKSSLGEEEVFFTTQELSDELNMHRSNISSILNELASEDLVKKTGGRPVYYSLVKNVDRSRFREMVGSGGSLKQVIQLTKAALLYPGHFLPILITGVDGSGKSLLAKLIYEYSKEENIIKEESPFIKVNCKYLIGEDKGEIRDIFFSEDEGVFKKARGGVLFIDHINMLSHDIQNELLNYVEGIQNSPAEAILLYSVNDSISKSYLSLYRSKFSIVVDLPSLSERPFEERLELIQLFFNDEAMSIKKDIKINSEVMRCLMLYPVKYNVKQLKRDIQLACANGYARNIQNDGQTIELTIHDFPSYVRKGFLYYRKYRAVIEDIIPDNYLYSFSEKKMDLSYEGIKISSEDNYYNMIDKKVSELKSFGMEDEDIMSLIQGELLYKFQKLNTDIRSKEVDKEAILKIVDERLIEFVNRFLKEASLRFDRIYSNSVFYGLSLHLQAMIDRNESIHKLSNEQIVKTIKDYNDEYIFSSKFFNDFKKEFSIEIGIEEIALLTLFIAKENEEDGYEGKPVVLVCMHGNSTAKSIVEVTDRLMGEGNIFSFDLSLDEDMQVVYEELMEKVIEIHQGKGILMLYDMGSLKAMGEMISKETGIEIKSFCLPATLIALDSSRKANTYDNLNDLYDQVVISYRNLYPEIEEAYKKGEKPQVILSLCMTGEGGALQVKKYIEKHLYLENTEIIPLQVSDQDALLKKVNQIQKTQNIICVIGSFNPKLHGISYIPISKLFNTPVDKLEILLSLNTGDSVMLVNYDAIFEYLEEELVDFDIKLLKEILPRVILKIRKKSHGLSSDQEVGLFMHIACTIYRLQNGEDQGKNEKKEKIIQSNKRLYNDLKDILALVEDEFYIKFSDDEISYIIQIIKKC